MPAGRKARPSSSQEEEEEGAVSKGAREAQEAEKATGQPLYT